jgi:serine/threonine-protein kinase
MAEVFEATVVGAEGFERRIAIKRILPAVSDDPQFAAMFINEARITSRLRHPNILQTLDFDRDEDGRLFIVMELVDGVDLATLLRSRAIEVPQILHIVRGVLSALAYAHDFVDVDGTRHPIVHRDVSPHNVLIARDGTVKLADFGIAKALGAASQATSAVLKGKPAYMAPPSKCSIRAASTTAPTSSPWARSCSRCWPASACTAAPPLTRCSRTSLRSRTG